MLHSGYVDVIDRLVRTSEDQEIQAIVSKLDGRQPISKTDENRFISFLTRTAEHRRFFGAPLAIRYMAYRSNNASVVLSGIPGGLKHANAWPENLVGLSSETGAVAWFQHHYQIIEILTDIVGYRWLASMRRTLTGNLAHLLIEWDFAFEAAGIELRDLPDVVYRPLELLFLHRLREKRPEWFDGNVIRALSGAPPSLFEERVVRKIQEYEQAKEIKKLRIRRNRDLAFEQGMSEIRNAALVVEKIPAVGRLLDECVQRGFFRAAFIFRRKAWKSLYASFSWPAHMVARSTLSPESAEELFEQALLHLLHQRKPEWVKSQRLGRYKFRFSRAKVERKTAVLSWFIDDFLDRLLDKYGQDGIVLLKKRIEQVWGQ